MDLPNLPFQTPMDLGRDVCNGLAVPVRGMLANGALLEEGRRSIEVFPWQTQITQEGAPRWELPRETDSLEPGQVDCVRFPLSLP